MTTKYKTRAFIFKKEDRNESDRVFSVFTDEFGRLDIFAKAIRKTASKLRSGIDIFSLSEIEFIQGKNKKTLTDAIKVKKFENIARDLQKLKIAYKIADILDSFIKGEEKDKETFALLAEVFDKLEDGAKKIKNHGLAYQYFLWNFISLQGYHLQTQNCAGCKEKLNPYNIYFSCEDGGIICGNCVTPGVTRRINSDIVKILRLIFKKDWDMILKLKIEPSSQKLLEEISETAAYAFCPS